jgi:hypothetical protein
MTNLNITLNNEKFNYKLEKNRSKRLQRYVYNYVVERVGWQMAENIIENLFDAKNVNFHDPKFPFIDLIVKRNNKVCTKNDLLNIKSSRQKTLRSAIYSSLRGKNPKIKFLVSQINYILRSTNTRRAGDQMIGSKIVKSVLKSKNIITDLKATILYQYNLAHDTDLKNFNDIPTLQEKVSMCFVYNPTYVLFQNEIVCQLDIAKTYAKTFKHLFNRTITKCFDENYSIADLVFYVFQEKNDQFSQEFRISTFYDKKDIEKITKIYGLKGTMSNLKNDLINQIRDMGNVRELRQLRKEISTRYLH